MKKSMLLIMFFAFSFVLSAQNLSEMEFPNDTTVRIGTLENGMTYYIAKNKKPEGMANFYIVHNVGAMQEEDHQNGLAHFLEHMAFNGTKNFPNKNLLEYLETIGVQFGRNVNAYTSQEETVYMLMDVPTSRESIIDSAMLILNDWSHYISLEGEEIDKERGVILEELRTGLGAQRRIFNKIAPLYFNHSKFADRTVIGTEEILKTFKYDDIRTFYHDWYRTDNQAIIIVGDFNTDKVETKVKDLFSKIPAVKNEKPLVYTQIEDYKNDEVLVVSDPEQTYNSAMIITPIETLPLEMNSTIMAKATNTGYSMMSAIINERLNDLSQSPDADFVFASVGVSSRTRHQDVFNITVVPKGTDFAPAIDAVVKEIVRVRKYGFSEAALERVKANLLKTNEEVYANRDSRKNEEIVRLAMNNFMKNTPILNPELSYEVNKQFITATNVQVLNQMLANYTPERPSAIIVVATDKDVNSIDSDTLLKSYQSALKAEVEQLKEDKIDKPLISKEPVAGSVIKESEDEYGDTVWELSNGAQVVIRTTDYKKDELIFSANKSGGESLLSDKDIIASSLISSISSISGVGDFSANDLSKLLAGKSVSVNYGISSTSSNLSGRCSVSDVETLAKLIYLTATSPRFTQEDLDVFKKMLKVQFENLTKDPNVAFSDSLARAMYNDNPRLITTTQLIDGYKNIEVEQLYNIYKTVFNGADGSKFYFVGNVNKETLKPLIEKYVASIPKGKLTPFVKGVTPEFTKTDKVNIFKKQQENPKASVGIVFNVEGFDYTIENLVNFEALKHVLNIRYIEVVREEKGATYGVRLSASIDKEPKTEFTLTATFDTNGDVAEETAKIIVSELEKIAKEGPISTDLLKAREAFLKNFKNAQIENNSWLSWMKSLNQYNLNYIEDYENIVNNLNAEKIKETAKMLTDKAVRVEVIMLPE